MYMLGSFTGSMASIGLTLAAALIGGMGDYLENNTDRIKKFLISAFNVGADINLLLADLFRSIAYVFEAFASENGIRFVSALIGSIADAAMGLTELALKLGRDFLQMLIVPFTENADGFKTALEGLLGGAATVLEGFKTAVDKAFDSLNAMYDAHIKPLFDSITSGLSEVVNHFLTAWNTHIQPVIDRIGTRISELLTQSFLPAWEAIIRGVGLVADILKSFWESILQPIVDWIMTYAVPFLVQGLGVLLEFIILGIKTIVDGFTTFMTFINDCLEFWKEAWAVAWDTFNDFWNKIKSIIDIMKTVFRLFVKVVKQLIDGDWKGAWNTAQEIFTIFKTKVEGVVDSIKAFLSGFFTWVSDMIAGVIEEIKNIGSGIKNAFTGGGSSKPRTMSTQPYAINESFASRTLRDIPALASGSVIRGGNPFLAILGDQRAGQTNIEAPIGTIKQAVSEVMAESGGGFRTAKIVLQVNGVDLAQATLQDFLSEASRQGYDLEVIGG